MAKKRPILTRAAHVYDLLTINPTLARCLEQQRDEDRLLAQVHTLLAQPARSHCISATLTEGKLSLTADTAAWATRLRYMAPDLTRGLAESGVIVVKVRARPQSRGTQAKTARRLSKLSPAVSDHLMMAADHIEDAGIATALRRLASRGQHASIDEPIGLNRAR
jgi:hypothetical protein